MNIDYFINRSLADTSKLTYAQTETHIAFEVYARYMIHIYVRIMLFLSSRTGVINFFEVA